MSHTPGPWKFDNGTLEDDIFLITAGKHLLAAVYHAGLEWEDQTANARLIAAAPELLEALKNIIANLDPGGNPIAYFGMEAVTADSVSRARTAIAKAEGR